MRKLGQERVSSTQAMPRRILKRLIPHREKLAAQRSLRVLGDWLHDDNLWHLNRQSASMAVFVGILVAFIPVPGQMLLAAAIALLLRCNLPIAVALVWITNPVTMPPVFWATYKLGTFLLDMPVLHASVHFNPAAIMSVLGEIWQPLLVGSLVCGIFFGGLGYALMRLTWRLHVIRRWQQRRARRSGRERP